MQMYLQVFVKKHSTMLQESHKNFLRKTICFIVHLSCCRPPAKPYLDYKHVCDDNWHYENKNNLRTIEAQIVQKLKTNEALPKFTGSYF